MALPNVATNIEPRSVVAPARGERGYPYARPRSFVGRDHRGCGSSGSALT